MCLCFFFRIEIKEDTDLDDSVEIVKIIPPTRKRVRRVVEKEPEIIVSKIL